MRKLHDIKKQKHIALIAHDGKKIQLINWIKENKEIISKHFLCGTGTTARMIIEETSLPVRAFESGPIGATSK